MRCLLGHVGLEPAALLAGVAQFMEGVGELDAAAVELETLGYARVVGARLGERRLARRIGMEERRPADPEPRLDAFAQDAAENVRPGVVGRDADADFLGLTGENRSVRFPSRGQAFQKIDSRMALKRLAHADAFRRLERVGLPAAKFEPLRARDMGRERQQLGAIVHQAGERRADPIPFEHREFRRMQSGPLAVAKDVREGKDLRLAGGDELLHREFRRSVQPGLGPRAVRRDERGAKSVQMGLVSGRNLEGGDVDLDEAVGDEPSPDEAGDARSRDEAAPALRVPLTAPERRRGRRTHGTWGASATLASSPLVIAVKFSIKRGSIAKTRLENGAIRRAKPAHAGIPRTKT